MESAARSIADALWDGVRHEPPVASAAGGARALYLRRIYHPVVRRRRARIWGHRSPEPWLSAQWLLERAAGQAPERGLLRFEGLPGQHSYDEAYRAVERGHFAAPFLFVAGFSRSGTTSLQNLVLTAFPAHVPPGRWDEPGHPLRLWWYPKHDADTGARIAGLGRDEACTLLCLRPFAESAASLAVYRGFASAEDLPPGWVDQQLDEWSRMARLARLPGTVTVAFSRLVQRDPHELAWALSAELGLEIAARRSLDTWEDVYDGGISPEVLDDPAVSNLPHQSRQPIAQVLRERIEDQIGSDLAQAEQLYDEAMDGALAVEPLPPTRAHAPTGVLGPPG